MHKILDKMAEVLFHGRKLEDLKVMEIKEELGRRGLNKKGIKSVLMKRLEAALLAEKREEVSLSGLLYSNVRLCNDTYISLYLRAGYLQSAHQVLNVE